MEAAQAYDISEVAAGLGTFGPADYMARHEQILITDVAEGTPESIILKCELSQLCLSFSPPTLAYRSRRVDHAQYIDHSEAQTTPANCAPQLVIRKVLGLNIDWIGSDVVLSDALGSSINDLHPA